MSFIKRFKNSITGLFALIMYALCMLVLFLLLGVENWQILDISRTSIMMGFVFIVMGFLLVRAYGGYNVGVRKSRPIVISLSIALVLDDILTYLVLVIMNTNDENGRRIEFSSVGFLIVAMLCQVIIITIFTHIGNSFYFAVNPAEKTLIITGDSSQHQKIRAAIEIFHRRYAITGMTVESDPDLAKKVKESDSVVFYDVSKKRLEELTEICYGNYISVYINPNIDDILLHSGREQFFSDLPFYHCEAHRMTFEQRIIKRLGDILISLLGLIITSPLFLIASVMIKKEDGGSVFFRQERATVGGRRFNIIKFRTMKENAEIASVTKDDDRITKAGRWLRKYRIDELPQLVNILLGEMSLVGPRPEMMKNVEEYTEDLPEFRYRLRMKAGLTGYAQVMGKYNTTSRDKLILDLMYIENFSIVNDIRILLQTVTVFFSAEESTEGFDGD
ncbi:MAG: exopolysaccharide biosynthesis polyprenyl glycosylphosphotransferase [Lachnospiraceae bacterium]|nr:exopolysaccharide biosynthesis polyprenyl glycosylphosphotransferase [Lachnospiraceae bacterium]